MSKFSEKVKVEIHPTVEGEVPSDDWRSLLKSANWTDDPGTGRAVHLPDGREVFNPVPMAPPIGYVQEDSIETMIRNRIAKHFAQLSADMEVDSAEDFEDFDVGDEDFDPLSVYEIALMKPDAPGLEGGSGAQPPTPAAPQEAIPNSDPPPNGGSSA